MCVNAGPPFTSPNAQTPGALVSSRSLTIIKPFSLTLTPALSRSRACVFGVRPAATSRCDPDRVSVPLEPSTFKVALQLGRDVIILVRQDSPRALYDGHRAAKAPKHLSEFQPDVSD